MKIKQFFPLINSKVFFYLLIFFYDKETLKKIESSFQKWHKSFDSVTRFSVFFFILLEWELCSENYTWIIPGLAYLQTSSNKTRIQPTWLSINLVMYRTCLFVLRKKKDTRNENILGYCNRDKIKFEGHRRHEQVCVSISTTGVDWMLAKQKLHLIIILK